MMAHTSPPATGHVDSMTALLVGSLCVRRAAVEMGYLLLCVDQPAGDEIALSHVMPITVVISLATWTDNIRKTVYLG
jgi:hypothetical protein